MLQLLMHFRFGIRRTRNIEQRRRRPKRAAPRAAIRRRRELLLVRVPPRVAPCHRRELLRAAPRCHRELLRAASHRRRQLLPVLLPISIEDAMDELLVPLTIGDHWLVRGELLRPGVGMAAAGGVGGRMELPLERERSKSIPIVLFITEKGNGRFIRLEIA
jgi:hypothetical protein